MGLIESTMSLGPFEWPDEVKENFEEKVEKLHTALEQELAEFIQFGEALDNAGEDS